MEFMNFETAKANIADAYGRGGVARVLMMAVERAERAMKAGQHPDPSDAALIDELTNEEFIDLSCVSDEAL